MPTPPIPSTRTVYVIQYLAGSSWLTRPVEYPTLHDAKKRAAEWQQQYGVQVRYARREITDTVFEEEE